MEYFFWGGPRPHFGGVVEVYPSNFSWRSRGTGGVVVRYSLYMLGTSTTLWGCGRGLCQ